MLTPFAPAPLFRPGAASHMVNRHARDVPIGVLMGWGWLLPLSISMVVGGDASLEVYAEGDRLVQCRRDDQARPFHHSSLCRQLSMSSEGIYF